jgi:hypothetical protein
VSTSLPRVSIFLGFLLSYGFVIEGCGGRALDIPGDGGSSSSSGGSSGSSSGTSGGSSGSSSGVSGGSSGSSSGISGSSSGISGSSSGISGSSSGVSGSSSGISSSSSGGSGSSSGSQLPCSPYPPSGTCDYIGQTCEYPYGPDCDQWCTCESGLGWVCGVQCSTPPPPPSCPVNPPGPGDTCSDYGLSCAWGQGCGSEQCTCDGQYWECSGIGCPPPPPPTCPGAPPGNGQACGQPGIICDYPINNNVCSDWECYCNPGNYYSCYETDCFDGGVGVDAGFADAGMGI